MKKYIIFLLLLGILPLAIEKRTDGFTVQALYFTLPIAIDCSTIEKQNFEDEEHIKVLEQEYVYLGKGTQFYVFESADKKYVIKFLRDHHLKPKLWVHFLRFPNFLDLYRKEEILHRRQKCEKTVKACFVAFERMQKRLGLLGLYFKKPTSHKLKVRDKIGRKYQIDLSNTYYVIQKKADAFLAEALNNATSQNDVEKIVDLFLEGITYRCQKQISNTDPNVFSNFALLEDHVVEVDFGDFFDNGSLIPPPLFNHEISRYAKSFRKWANKNMPEILLYFDERLQVELKKYRSHYEDQTF